MTLNVTIKSLLNLPLSSFTTSSWNLKNWKASTWKNKTQPPWNFPLGIYLLKINNKNTRTRCEICSNAAGKFYGSWVLFFQLEAFQLFAEFAWKHLITWTSADDTWNDTCRWHLITWKHMNRCRCFPVNFKNPLLQNTSRRLVPDFLISLTFLLIEIKFLVSLHMYTEFPYSIVL